MDDQNTAAVPQPAPVPAPEISEPVELAKVLPPWLAEAIEKRIVEIFDGDFFSRSAVLAGMFETADERLKAYVDVAIENSAATIVQKVSELLAPVVAKSAELTAAIAAKSAAYTEAPGVPVAVPRPHVLAPGDRVKVWADADKQNFHTGTVELVHDGDAKFDVAIEGLGVSTIPADGLEYDPLG